MYNIRENYVVSYSADGGQEKKHLSIERNTEETYLNIFEVKLLGATTQNLQNT